MSHCTTTRVENSMSPPNYILLGRLSLLEFAATIRIRKEKICQLQAESRENEIDA